MNTLTCVYCGQAYPAGTPASGSDIKTLTDHIKICPKHPMREAEAKIKRLRDTLMILVDAESKEQLIFKKDVISMSSLPENEKIKEINAIDTLIWVMEDGE
jgi:hypothetical protein